MIICEEAKINNNAGKGWALFNMACTRSRAKEGFGSVGGRCNHTGAKHLTLEIVVPYTCNISEPSQEMDRRKNDKLLDFL